MNDNNYPVVENEHVIGAKKKEHHFFRNFFITIFVIVLILGGAVGAFYGCFYDSTKSNLNLIDGVNHEDVLSAVVVDSINDTKDSNKIEFKIDEEDMNYLLKETHESLDPTIKQYVKEFYVDIHEDNYDLYINCELPYFATRICLKTKAVEHVAKNYKDNEIRFHIQDIKVGRIGGMFDIALSVLAKFIDMNVLNQLFINAGLNINVNLNGRVLTYKEVDLLNDLNNIMGGKDNMVFNLLETFYDNELIKFNFKDSLGAYVDLKDLAGLETSDLLSAKLESKRHNIETLLTNKTITTDEVNDVMFYLLRGYDMLSAKQKSLIEAKDFSSILISDKKNYKGAGIPSALDLGSLVKNNIESNLEPLAQNIVSKRDQEIAKISDDEISSFLRYSNVLGMSYSLSRYDKITNKYHVNYIAISDFYTEIKNDLMSINCNLNLNGFILKIRIDLTITQSDLETIEFKVANAEIGSLPLGLDFKTQIFELIKQSLTNDAYLKVDPNSLTIKLNLAAILSNFTVNLGIPGYEDDLPLKNILKQFNYKLATKFVRNSNSKNGHLTLSAIYNA